MENQSTDAEKEKTRNEIARYIKTTIRCNHLQENAKLPSENSLAAQFHVNRNTVRGVYSELAAQGIVYSKQGKGFFVAHRQKPIVFHHENGMGFSEILNDGTRRYVSKVIEYHTFPSGPSEHDIFGVEPGTKMHSLMVLRVIDMEPFAICHSILPDTILPDFGSHLDGFTSVNRIIIEDYGYAHPICRSIRLSAELPSSYDMRYLQIPSQQPILKQINTFEIPGTGIVEYFIVRARGDRFHFSMTFGDGNDS